jgi:hypothetical protein
MEKEGVHKTAKVIRDIARIVLLFLAVLLFVFFLLSGAESLGGGMKGFVNNFPNTIPWIFLLIAVFITFKWELAGGLIILIMGIFTIFFFNALENLFVLFGISIPLIVLAKLLIIAWYLSWANN